MQWRTYINSTCLAQQQYRFGYDAASRLTAGDHYTNPSGTWTFTNNYTESNLTYDLNGNIKTYTRRGLTVAPSTFGVIDQLTYSFGDVARPDRLTDVQDAGSVTKGFKDATSPGTNYTYDLNGNLTQDNNKSLTLNYNHLNLPNSINNPALSYITMTYTADGEKLTKVSSAGTRNYVAGTEYLGANTEAIYHAEGRCTPNGTNFYYQYTLKDHLGNARVNFQANGTSITYLEDFHYYPFGMQLEGIGTTPPSTNKYLYNGKELNDDLGLNMYDYGARWYDPTVGRWWSIDPMAAKFNGISPYSYVNDNPLRHIDPSGMAAQAITFSGGFGGDDPNPFAKFKALGEKISRNLVDAKNNAGKGIKDATNNTLNAFFGFGDKLNNWLNQKIPSEILPVAETNNTINSGMALMTDRNQPGSSTSTSESKYNSPILMVSGLGSLVNPNGGLDWSISTKVPNLLNNWGQMIQKVDESFDRIHENRTEFGSDTAIIPGTDSSIVRLLKPNFGGTAHSTSYIKN